MRSIGLPELIVFAVIAVLMVVVRTTRYLSLGAAAGGLIGFLLRPSVPLVGQLPFDVVLTRGSNLRGIDLILKRAAETSFNYLLAGALIGGLAGLAMAAFVKTSSRPSASAKVADTAAEPGSTTSAQPPVSASHRFCIRCGTALPEGADYCGACGAKKTSI